MPKCTHLSANEVNPVPLLLTQKPQQKFIQYRTYRDTFEPSTCTLFLNLCTLGQILLLRYTQAYFQRNHCLTSTAQYLHFEMPHTGEMLI